MPSVVLRRHRRHHPGEPPTRHARTAKYRERVLGIRPRSWNPVRGPGKRRLPNPSPKLGGGPVIAAQAVSAAPWAFADPRPVTHLQARSSRARAGLPPRGSTQGAEFFRGSPAASSRARIQWPRTGLERLSRRVQVSSSGRVRISARTTDDLRVVAVTVVKSHGSSSGACQMCCARANLALDSPFGREQCPEKTPRSSPANWRT
jgi:hypothetical protein